MNRLAHEHSPYLLQHKDNPVDWYPWGAAAFEKAQKEDKPIFLSIGYATCHWCHVMEHESFEDDEVARLMNDAFVSIKVDREERPDVDAIYMTVCQMMTGHGGWPLTILMTPEKKPFYAATYLPKHGRFGRVGMMELVPRIEAVWHKERDKVLASADHLTGLLRQTNTHPAAEEALDQTAIENAYGQLRQRFDDEYGGFGAAPKFPSSHNLLFLLRHWKRTSAPEALQMVEETLRAMRRGGIYDHVGYGFHRYATDRLWRLPHFEKMLYDQALLAMAYTEAFQATGNPLYQDTAREVFTYVLRDMTSPEGGFYSAEDADSEGREGAFYVWTSDELREVLGDEADLVMDVYNIEENGNFEDEATRKKTGENVLFLNQSIETIAQEKGISETVLQERLEAARQALFDHRENRVRPGKDDKVLTDWNGLMIAAMAKAAAAFTDDVYAEAARRAARFVLEALRTSDGRLLHRWRNGHAGISGHLDDYAFLAWGLLELYEATLDPEWLEEAVGLAEAMKARFWDSEHGGFYLTDEDGGEDLIVRPKELYDGAIPSGNAVALTVLLRLGRLTGEARWEETADALLRWAAAQVRQHPSGFTALLVGLQFALGPTHEVVVVGERTAADTEAMLQALRTSYLPGKVLLFRPAGEDEPRIADVAPFVRAHHALDGKATAYVCENYQCQAPTSDVDEVLALLDVRADTADAASL